MPNKKNNLPSRISRVTKIASVALLFLLQLMLSKTAVGQTLTVKGKVLTETGSAIEGASIVQKGTNNGTVSDNAGAFSINVPSGSTLVISAVGYGEREVAVKDGSEITVQLALSDKSLSEVVVIGYGTQRKIDVTGAVASVNLEARRDLPMTNIGQVMQGTVPGLNVGLSTNSGGTPPISIRGRVTLSGNQNVLIILDGIQYTGSLSSINPDDIANIDVLKDASSTAVYGAQAANGVILITSKKGRKSEKPRLSFSSSYTVQKPTIGDLRPYDRDGFIKFMTDNFYDKAYLGPDFKQPNPTFRLQDWIDPVLGTPAAGLQPHNYDWFDEATNNGSIFETSLSVSGGSDRFTYFLSGALFLLPAFQHNLLSLPIPAW